MFGKVDVDIFIVFLFCFLFYFRFFFYLCIHFFMMDNANLSAYTNATFLILVLT